MSLQDQPALRIVLYEGAGAVPIGPDRSFALLEQLLERGYSVTCARERGQVSAPDQSPLLVLGEFQAAPAIGEAEGSVPLEFLNVGELSDAGVIEGVEQARARRSPGEQEQVAWKPWFPVIDYDRCTNCMQCLSFCLFGVYGVDEQHRIQVQNNDQCKTNCPACSRVCPEAAIMFPKYKSGPINGEPVSAGDLQREKMKVDISALLGGDIYQVLRDRSARAQSRFSKERSPDKALAERQKCLVKLQQLGDIPPEVLMSLPPPDEIERRAREAMARAEAARSHGAD